MISWILLVIQTVILAIIASALIYLIVLVIKALRIYITKNNTKM